MLLCLFVLPINLLGQDAADPAALDATTKVIRPE
jgi:hypothetical protein